MVPLSPYYFEVIMVNGVVCMVIVMMNGVSNPSGVLCIFH